MSNKVTTPYPLFSDIDGSPLNAGFLFLGESEKDAEQFPIVAYWDEAKTQIVSQPIATRNGFIVRDNLPAKIYIDEVSCSLTIKNQFNTVVQTVLTYDQLSTAKGVKALIESEKDRAETQEGLLNIAINSEITRANLAETQLNQKIEEEKSRAIGVEENLQLQISTSSAGLKFFSKESDLLTFTPGPTDPQQAYAFDTKKMYLWDGTKWIDEGLSQLDQAKILIDQLALEISKLMYISSGNKSLFDFADPNGSLVFQILNDGKIRIVDLDDDLVTYLNRCFEFRVDDYIFLLLDSEKNIIAYVDKSSKLFIVGLDTDVATAINSKASSGLEITDTNNLVNYSYRDTFIPKAQNLLNFFRNTQNVGLLAPVPLQTFEQNFSINTDWLDLAKITTWGNYIPIKTPYGDNKGVVHPQILEIPNKFLGYRYIVTITGYTNGALAEENPFLLGSNDLQSFELLTGLIDEPDSYTWEHGTVYNSDCFTFYDYKTGELCVMFRTFWADTDGVEPNLSYEKLFIRRTKDGKSWSDRQLLNDKFPLLAPAILFDAKTETYHLYGVTNGIKHYTSKTLKNDWVLVGDISFPADKSPWHVDIKWVGDKQVIVVHDRIFSPSSKNRGFFIGISSNLHNFTWAADFWNTPDYSGVYKATFLPQFSDNNLLRLVFMWTTDGSPVDVNLRYKLFMQPTPFLDVGFMETQ